MKKVNLEEVLALREKRLLRRKNILSEYNFPLACLSLNIPGECKDFPWARRSFHDETEAFTLALEAEGITVFHEEREEESAGYTAYISAGAEAAALKTLAVRIEETHPLGRLFDIDVFEPDIHDPSGRKLSRAEDPSSVPRPCFVCGENAFLCGRSRAHAPEELNRAVLGIMETWLKQNLGDRVCSAALWAMTSELAITPKPGLVDRANNGAHHDMDFFSFIDSASALLPWFRSCALEGFDSSASPAALFEALRPPGRTAEVVMKKATGGVNTHRGYIFSLGILCAAYGRLFREKESPDLEELLELTREMTKTLMQDFSRSGKEQSHGEAVYAQSGIKGIRGEVSRGFPAVTEFALPMLRNMLNKGYSLNDAGVAAILVLMAHAEDSNIIHRGGEEVFRSLQEDLRSFFALNPGMEAIKKKAAALDSEFISGNLSPGGSADLLGTVLFMYRLFKLE